MAQSTVVVSFVGETSNLVQSVDRATRTVSVFQSRLGGLRQDSRKIENALFNLAGAATGLQGPMGKLAEIGLQFAVGGGWAMAIAGGVALAAAAYEKLTSASAAAEAAQSAYFKRLAQGAQEFSRFTGQALLAAEAQAKLDFLQARREVTNLQATFATRPATAQELQALAGATGRLQQAEAGLDMAIGNVVQWMGRQGEAAKDAAPKVGALASETGKLADALERANLARQRDQRIDAAGGGNRLFPEGTNLPDHTQGAAPDFLAGGGRTFGEGSRVGEVAAVVERSKKLASEWQATWQRAAFAVGNVLADTFASLFERGRTFLEKLQSLIDGVLKSLTQVAAQLLATKIVGYIGGAIAGGAGGGAITGVDAIPAGGGLAMRAQPVQVTNYFSVSAIDARGVEEVLLAHYGAVTAATVRGLSESRAAALALGLR